MFDVDQFTGTLAVTSDLPIVLAGEQMTQNIEGQPIMTEIPYMDSRSRNMPVLFPLIMDGKGMTTELRLVNPGKVYSKGDLEFSTLQGEEFRLILR